MSKPRLGAHRPLLQRFAERCYSLSLRAYSPAFRVEVAAEMRATFADRCRAAATRGTGALLAVWWAAMFDSLHNGVTERWQPHGSAPLARRNLPRSPRRRPLMSSILDDFKRAARRLRRAPVFTLCVLMTVAVGVGAFVSIYSMLDNVLWEAMPYEDPDRLAYVWRNYTWADFPRGWAGGVEVVAMRGSADAIEGVAAVRSGAVNLSSRDGGEPQEIPVTLTSAGFFDLLGVQPLHGRGFAAGEDFEGAPLVAVLGHELWQQRYGGDPSIVGRTIYLDDEAAEVIGIMPASFHFAVHSSLGAPSSGDAYLNLRWDLSAIDGGSLAALVRVRRSVSPEQLQAQLDTVVAPIDEQYFNGRGLRLWPAFLREDLVAGVRPALVAIAAAASFMLLLLGVNLATLLLGRATRRARALAVSAALGASRGALLRDGMAESLLLTLTGGMLGLLVARLGTALIADLAVDLPRRYAVTVDGSVALAGISVAILLGVAAGAVPALRATRTDVATTLRSAGGRVTAGRAPGAMVVAQVAISLILLVGAGVLTRSLLYMMRSDPGFDADGVLTLRVPATSERFPEDADLLNYFDRLRGEIAALPGVGAVGATNALPLTRGTNQTAVSFPASPRNTGAEDDNLLIDWFTITPGYLEAMGVPLRVGRDFTAGDGADAPLVAIIDDTLAERFFPNEDVVGRTMRMLGEERTVVAVVDQPRLYDIHKDDRGQVFLPLGQWPRSSVSLAVRTTRDPRALAAELIGLVRTVDADQPIADVRTMHEIAAESLNGERLSLGLIGGFALGALLLATLGLYGVVSNGVTSRTREMGVRMALGATAGKVRSLVVGRGMRLVGLGTLLGLVGSFATARFLESLLVGVQPTDPLTLAAAAAGMAAVTFAACYLPARRASNVDPLVSLRAE